MAQPRVRLAGQTDAEAAAAQAAEDAAEKTTAGATTSAEEAPEQVDEVTEQESTTMQVPRFGEHDGVDEILCLVPKPIRLVLGQDGSHTPIDAGLQKLPRAVAEHWWCKVNGVTAAPQ